LSAATGWRRAAVLAALVVSVDQGVKAAVVSSLRLGESVELAPGLALTHVRNTGVAFGVLAGSGLSVALLSGLALTVLLLWFAGHAGRPGVWLPVGLLVGGALGNLADRARVGSVIDYVDPVAWPAFNVADSCIVLGIVAMVVGAEREGRGREGG
jgi:signal peptidase II